MLAPSAVGMLIKALAVKFCQSVSVSREVSGNPVHNYTHAVFMALIYKILQISRRSESAVCTVISRNLISPRAVKRILRKRHYLYMCITHLFNIRYKLIRHFSVSKISTVLMGFPRAEMHFVNIYRRIIRRRLGAFFDPRIIAPFIGQVRSNRRIVRSDLAVESIGI